MKLSRLAVGVSMLASVVLAAGCGSSSSSSTKASAPASSSTSTPTQTATSPSASASTTSAILVSTKKNRVGTILAAGPKKLTVYLFQGDKGTQSSCSGVCAKAWPPVIGKPTAAGQASTSNLGTITRSDGTTQVTYKGHPLYYFIKDKDDGDAYGQGAKAFGADWYVLAPSGNKIDNS